VKKGAGRSCACGLGRYQQGGIEGIREQSRPQRGFNEVRAVVPGWETFPDLTEDDVNALSAGISRVLQ